MSFFGLHFPLLVISLGDKLFSVSLWWLSYNTHSISSLLRAPPLSAIKNDHTRGDIHRSGMLCHRLLRLTNYPQGQIPRGAARWPLDEDWSLLWLNHWQNRECGHQGVCLYFVLQMLANCAYSMLIF